MKLGNTQLEIQFDNLAIVEEYKNICRSCEDLRVVHNSVFEKKDYQNQYIKIKDEITEFINEWNDTFDETFTELPSYNWTELFENKKPEEYYEFHRVLNVLHFESLKHYDSVLGTKYYPTGEELLNIINRSRELRILIEDFFYGTDTSRLQFKYDGDTNKLLTTEQLKLFSFGKKRGDVFLSYNTAGIEHENYIKEHVPRKNTSKLLEVVKVLPGYAHDYIRPQISFSSDITVYLGDEIKHTSRMKLLKESIHSWNLVTARLWNFDNYKNAFGLIKIGRLKKQAVKSKLKGLQGIING
tara:strand:+ start:1021 stop:1914 length:894 start_codon:yes stop_codon:yes gene_type:complete